MLRTTLHIRIDRDDEIEDVFHRVCWQPFGQRLNVMSFSAPNVQPRRCWHLQLRGRWNPL